MNTARMVSVFIEFGDSYSSVICQDVVVNSIIMNQGVQE